MMATMYPDHPVIRNVSMDAELVEITRGPTLNHPGDTYRRFVPGPTTVTVDLINGNDVETWTTHQPNLLVPFMADPGATYEQIAATLRTADGFHVATRPLWMNRRATEGA